MVDTTTPIRAAGLVAVLWTVWSAPAGANPAPTPTPEIRTIDALNLPDTVAYAMRAPLGAPGAYVGLGVLCPQQGPPAPQVTAFFGTFPGPHQPVQLAVRGPDGTVERFGPVVAGGPESGVHSPQLRAPADARRFVTAALQPGALISNGHNSFRNRVPAARNQHVRQEFLTCLQRTPTPQ